MNIKNLFIQLTALVILQFSMSAYAEKPELRTNEVGLESIKLAKDRTGIIEDVSCFGCNFSRVKITTETKATRNGVPVDILEVRKLKDKVLAIEFDPKTREVVLLRWN